MDDDGMYRFDASDVRWENGRVGIPARLVPTALEHLRHRDAAGTLWIHDTRLRVAPPGYDLNNFVLDMLEDDYGWWPVPRCRLCATDNTRLMVGLERPPSPLLQKLRERSTPRPASGTMVEFQVSDLIWAEDRVGIPAALVPVQMAALPRDGDGLVWLEDTQFPPLLPPAIDRNECIVQFVEYAGVGFRLSALWESRAIQWMRDEGYAPGGAST